MGKGDKKSKKGKIAIGSYGVTRKRHTRKSTKHAAPSAAEPAAETPAKAKKTARKKSDA